MLHDEIQPASERIEELFDMASELPAELRAGFLDSRLDPLNESDSAVRAEVERLLLHHDTTGILDETLIGSSGFREPAPYALAPGELLGERFRIRRMLGAGGMGEVYEAEDLTAGQVVALKTIRTDMARDSSQAERFRRELLISRNIAHRNVCKVFEYNDFDRGANGRLRFFTMELLQGETLAQRLASASRLAPGTALEILEQVAAGLDEVHRGGIIHRDLKPSNIFLVREADGRDRAVVMDFGLARNLTDSDLRQTSTGMVMGTRLYMAPELPKSAGVFSDVYSFGVVALELVTGSACPLIPPRSVVSSLDPVWDKALLACFSLDPAKRPASATAVVEMLRRRTRPWRKFAIAAGIAVTVAAAGTAAWKTINPSPKIAKGPTQITFDSFTVDPTTSADGKLLAYASDRHSPEGDLNIWLLNMETNQTRQITSDPGDEDEPALSPDGRMIAWRSHREDTLYVKPVAGGTARALVRHAFAPRFSPDGRSIAFWDGVEGDRSVPARVWVVPAAGGAPRNLAPGFADARFPMWLPDGKSILFRGSRASPPAAGQPEPWWMAAIDGETIRSTRIGDLMAASKLEDHDSPAIFDGERVIFAARAQTDGTGTNLWSVGFMPFLRTPVGTLQALTKSAGLQDVPALLGRTGIVYADLHARDNLFQLNVSTGNLRQITQKDSLDTRVSVSSDGRVLVFGRRVGSVRNIWTMDSRTGAERELAHNELAIPFVSPDGRTAAISAGTSIRLIDVATAHQTNECSDCGELRGWMPQTREVVYLESRPGLLPAIRALDLTTRSRRTLLAAQGLFEAAVSPDGATIAFTIRKDVYSTIFIAKLAGGIAGRENGSPVTPDNQWADKPVWSPDGKALYFRSTLDGFQCIWMRGMDAGRSKIIGPLQPVGHFHQAARSLSGITPAASGLALGGGNLFFSLAVTESNVFALRE